MPEIANRYEYRQLFVTPLVDKEAMHEKAFKLTSGEDAEEKVVVHAHSYTEWECNDACVTYPKDVSASGEVPTPRTA
jgi:hypothetical protein